MTTPAGWYDDGSGRQRWWDGQQWTEHVVTAPQSDANPTMDSADEPTTEPASEQAIEQANQPSEHATEHASEPVTEQDPTRAVEPAPFTPPYMVSSTTPANPTTPATGASPVGFTYPPAPGYPPAQGTPWPAQTAQPPSPGVPVVGIIGLVVVIIGVICACIPAIALVGWSLLVVGIVLSIVSLFLRGRKWAGITGLGVGAVGAVLALAVSLLVGISSSAGGDDTPFAVPSERPSAEESSAPTDPADIEGAEMKAFDELRVGDCLPLVDYGDVDEIFEVAVVPCEQPHTDEVYFIFDLDGTDFPGDAAITDAAWDGCLAEFESFVGTSYDLSELDFYNYQPTKSSWIRWGDRTVQCILFSYDDVTGTLQDAGY